MIMKIKIRFDLHGIINEKPTIQIIKQIHVDF